MVQIASDEGPVCRSTPARKLEPVPDAGHAEGLKSVSTALDVLECFATDDELGVSDIARRLGVSKSTAHRILTTLCSRGIAAQNAESGRYRLGLHLFELGHLALARHSLRHAALPIIRDLSQRVGHTVNLSVPDGADIVFIERIENSEGIRILGQVGRRLPAHCTSSGKAIAALNPDLDKARRAAGFPPRARRTVRCAADWQAQLEQARRRGFAMSTNESFDGVSSIAVPLIDGAGRAFAAVSVFAPTPLLAPTAPHVVAELRAAARAIVLALH